MVEQTDVLRALSEDTMTVQEVESFCARVMHSQADKLEFLLGLDHFEYIAYANGILFDNLAKWRYDGWPKVGSVCRTPIDHKKFGWFPRRDSDGNQGIAHIDCLPDCGP